MRKINFSRQAEKFLEEIPVRHAGQIVRKLDAYLENPVQVSARNLLGFPDLKRLKAGEYRIVLRDTTDCIFVELIDKRNDDTIYRKLARQK
jgi:mRNA-degrading endonuclease RelE of RelBE toxin-antitoxin system